jgi:ligand-binding SRPBCC domain-containing protein
MARLQDSIHINAPVEKVDKFTFDPHDWARFMVNMSEPDKVTGDGGVGTQVEFTVRVAGFPLHETVHVVEDRRGPDGSAHSRIDFEGTSPGWQTWDFKPEDGGTMVTMEMEYTVPGRALGKVVDRLLFEKMQKRDMHHSLENLKLFVEAS